MITSRWWLVALTGTGAAMIAILVVVGTPVPLLLTGLSVVIAFRAGVL